VELATGRKSALFEDEPGFFADPSSWKLLFEDEPGFFADPSSWKPLFEDEPGFFADPSSWKPLFEDEPGAFFQFVLPSCRKSIWCSEAAPYQCAKCILRTTLKAPGLLFEKKYSKIHDRNKL
jgi:hypothetical protein